MTIPASAAHWAWMINDSVTNDLTDVTPQVAAEAMRRHRQRRGEAYALAFRLDAKWIDSDDREALARDIINERNRKQ